MKSGIQEIVGKTISNVIAVECDTQPREQVFIVFSDDTYFEFFGKDVNGISGVRQGNVDDVIHFVKFARERPRFTRIYPEKETQEDNRVANCHGQKGSESLVVEMGREHSFQDFLNSLPKDGSLKNATIKISKYK